MKKVASWFIIFALAFLSLFAVLIATGHADVLVNRPNSLGISETYTNPNSYLMAVPLEATALEDGKYFNIRFAPYNTYALYDESVLFCGDVTPKFEGKNGVLVITYETRAHSMYKGIACHELVSVFEVK